MPWSLLLSVSTLHTQLLSPYELLYPIHLLFIISLTFLFVVCDVFGSQALRWLCWFCVPLTFWQLFQTSARLLASVMGLLLHRFDIWYGVVEHRFGFEETTFKIVSGLLVTRL